MAVTTPLKALRKIYLCVHALGWLEVPPGDPKRAERMWEQFPGRCELGYSLELQLQQKYQQLIRSAGDDEGIFFLPTGTKGNNELIELARQHLGARCVVCRLESDLDHNRQALGPEFVAGLEEDRRQATTSRGPGITQLEWEAWEHSKAWAIDLNKQLVDQEYTYDPATVELVAFGEDWCYCTATYSIHMSRALGLARPIERRFDLINPSSSPMLLNLTAVDQNLEMPEHIRLFIYKTADGGPTWGRYVAQYYEGMHGIMDSPHVVEVDFPPNSVTEINIFGWGIGRTLGIGGQYDSRGQLAMHVGCGGHTPHRATLVMAEESLSLEDFRAALLAGKVTEKR